jgi:hypothetical protein
MSYTTLDKYETATLDRGTPDGHLQLACNGKTCMKTLKSREKYGAFSISAAVRPPYNASYGGESIIKKIPGVS